MNKTSTFFSVCFLILGAIGLIYGIIERSFPYIIFAALFLLLARVLWHDANIDNNDGIGCRQSNQRAGQSNYQKS